MIFIFIAGSIQAQGVTDKRLNGLESEITKILKAQHAAGVAVAVVEKNKVVYAKGFGFRDVENKLPVTENTQFAIGSCTKAFTASLLGILQKDRSLDFDKPVTQYLPELRFFNDELNAHVTLRDMMCHRTGLPRHDLSWYIDPDERAALVKRIQYMEPSAGLRTRWQYNNFMFLLQGVVAEKLTGKSWEANISERIFSKIKMGHSNFSVKDLAQYQEPALGYNVIHDSVIHKMPYYEIGGMGPAGSINSTVTDMAQWLKVWINGGKLDTVEIIPSNYITEATSSQMIVAPGTPTLEKPDILFSNYGFGWFLASYKGHYRVEHGGNIDGFSANTSFYPTDSIGIVVLVNQNGSAVPSIVRNTIIDRMLGLKYFDWNADVTQATAKAKAKLKEAEKAASGNQVKGTHPSHDLKAYEGIYSNEGYGKFEVIARGDSLFVQLKKQRWWLQHFHYDLFRPFDITDGIDTSDQSPIRFRFVTGLNGEVESAALFQFEPALQEPILFKRSLAVKEISKEGLKKYEAVFILAGTEIKTYLKDKTLFVLVPGQPEYELAPVGQDRFDFKMVPGYSVVFQLDEKGSPSALTFQQPNGNFKAVIKK
jgi:CubicO group peptidase (beta-lactamase class C family)